MTRQGYVLAGGLSPEAADVVHRAVLLALRPAMGSAELDPEIEAPDRGAVARLHALAERQGRWPRRRWRFLGRSGADLDPAQDGDFELLLALSSSALLLDGFDRDGGELFSATDEGGLFAVLTTDQHEDVARRLAERGIAPDVLRPV